MDAELYFKEFDRMCKAYKACEGCPMANKGILCESISVVASHKNAVGIVEQWSKEHPVKTNWDKFKEVFKEYPDLTDVDKGGKIIASSWWFEPYEG